MITQHADDIEEARLLSGDVNLCWKTHYHMNRKLMSAQEFSEMIKDFDAMISIVEQEFPPDDERYQMATAMRKRWRS